MNQRLDPSAYETKQSLKKAMNSKVFKYVTDDRSQKDLMLIKRDAKENADKFFLIVADEAHWELVRGPIVLISSILMTGTMKSIQTFLSFK